MDFVCDHLHLRSPDPEAAAASYAALFGATIKDRVKVASGLRVILDLGGLRLLIEQVPPETNAAPPPPFIGIEHIALRVDDLDREAARLKQVGVRFLVEPNSPRPGVKVAFIEGPDRVRIEILERSRA
jgi:catechol 2,3-dioxygenase-like lactoylglutathione lyase family enzyme